MTDADGRRFCDWCGVELRSDAYDGERPDLAEPGERVFARALRVRGEDLCRFVAERVADSAVVARGLHGCFYVWRVELRLSGRARRVRKVGPA